MGKRRITGYWPDGFGHPWPVGTRVRLREDVARTLSGRTGVITGHRPINGGYLVLHEESSVSLDTDPVDATRGPFGWSYHELELLDPNAIIETDAEEDDWFDWPLH